MKMNQTKENCGKGRQKITVKDITICALMVAVIEVSKLALSFLPNIELTTFWLIMFTLFFGWRIIFVVPVFILIEGSMYGFGLWWIMYIYSWPLLVLLTWIFRRQKTVWFWAVLSGGFGLAFGALCAIPYFFIGASNGIAAGLNAFFGWWVAGIPWDIAHCVGNYVLMLILYNPIKRVMSRVNKLSGIE